MEFRTRSVHLVTHGYASAVLSLDLLGASGRATLRALLSTFRDHGWRDSDGAALALVHAIEHSRRGVSPGRAAVAMPADFLARNHISRSMLGDAPAQLIRHPLR